MFRALNDSMNANAAYLGGQERLRQKNYQGAIASFSEVIRLRPDFAPAYCDRAAAYLKTGQAAEAVADCDVAIRPEPGLCSRL